VSDVVVTLPKSFRLRRWIEEGDPAGDPESGQLYYWSIPHKAAIAPGERVYVVYDRRLIGYAPLVRLVEWYPIPGVRRFYLVRRGGAVAVTIPERIPGFRGFRYRWWSREEEIPFPEWAKA
jgi:hypothetical protein